MASKTFVQLYNDALQQADEVSGSGSATAKTIIKAGINESYAEVVSLRDWDQLKNSASQSTAAGTNLYTPVTSSSSVPRIRRIIDVLDQSNNRRIDKVERPIFEYQYPYVNTSDTSSRGAPLLWVPYDYTNSSRDLRLELYPVPDSVYTVQFVFYEEPLELSSDADIPRIPDQYHYGLGYLGLAKYFEYQKDPISSYYRGLHEQYKQKILNNEWDESTEMPQIMPNLRTRAVIIGKIGEVYNR